MAHNHHQQQPLRSSSSTGHRDTQLIDLPVSQELASKWHVLAMSHLLIQSTTKYAAADKPLSTFQLYNMLEGTSLFSMKFSQCPVPVDLLAVKSNSFCPPRPPDLDSNLLAKHLRYSFLDWKMTAGEEMEKFLRNNNENNKNNNMEDKDNNNSSTGNNKNGGKNTTTATNNNNIIPWDKFYHQANTELTNLIENPRSYEFRNPHQTSLKRSQPSFGVEGFASSVFWLIMVRQARAESKQNHLINETLSLHHRKKHRYDAEVGDLVWREALFEVLKPSSLTMMSSAAGEEEEEEDEKTLLRPSDEVSVSEIVHRVGGHVDQESCMLLKLLISGDEEPEAGALQRKLLNLSQQQQQSQLSTSGDRIDNHNNNDDDDSTMNNNNNDRILIEDSMHLLCVKRISDLDDALLEDLERWCERRVALWLIERFSPLHFSSSKSNTSAAVNSCSGQDPSRKYYRPYLLRCFFKIISTAVSRVITRLFNGTVTGGDITQKELWDKIRSKIEHMKEHHHHVSSSGASSPRTSSNRVLSPHQQTMNGSNNKNHQKQEIPPEVLHAQMVQNNIEHYLIDLASLAPVNTNFNSMSGNKNRDSLMDSKKQQQQATITLVPSPRRTIGRPASAVLPKSPRNGATLRLGRKFANAVSSATRATSNRSPIDNSEAYKFSTTSEDESNNNNNKSRSLLENTASKLMMNSIGSSGLPSSPLLSASSTKAASKSESQMKQQIKDSLRNSLLERKTGKQQQQFQIVLTDDEAAVRRDAAQRAAARRRTVALEEGEEDEEEISVVEGGTGQQQQKTQQSPSNNQGRRHRQNRYVGCDLTDKGIAIGDDSDYKKNLSTHSSTALMLKNVSSFGDGDEEGNFDHQQQQPEQSSRSILSSISKAGSQHQQDGGGGGSSSSGVVSASLEAKTQQQRAMSARLSARSVIDADRNALASHFGDLKTVITEMDKARMHQLLQLQAGSSSSAMSAALAAKNASLSPNNENNNDTTGTTSNNNKNPPTATTIISQREIEQQAKIAAAAKVKEMQNNRPRSAINTNNRNSSTSNNSCSSNVIPIHGLSKCAQASLRDSEEIVGHIKPLRPPQRTITLTPRGTNVRSANLKRWTIQKDLEGCLNRAAKAELKTEDEENEYNSNLIMHHFKRGLSNQSQADLERTVSVGEDRRRAESARKNSEKNAERKYLIKMFRHEVRTKLLPEDQIPKRCSTGMRAQEYYSALHSCKERIDNELQNMVYASSSSSAYNYTIKERNELRDLAMTVHRLMCNVRRNYSEHVEEFEEFELRRKNRKNAAVKREAEYL